IEERIAYFSSQKIIDIDLGDDPTPMPGAPCSIERDPFANPLGNPITEIHNCYFNQGEVKTDGVDATLRANFDLGGAGKLNSMLQASWIHEQTVDGGDNLAGITGFPKVRATWNNAWQRGDWNTNLAVRYIGSNGDYDAYTTFDANVGIELPWNAKATFGVNNFT